MRNKYMKPSEVVDSFKESMKEAWKQAIQNGGTEKGLDEWLDDDQPMASEAFNSFTDMLRTDKQIPAWVYDELTLDDDLDHFDDVFKEYQEALEFFECTSLSKEKLEEALNEVF